MSTKIADPMAMRDRVKKPRGPKSLFTICVWTILLSSSLSAASSSPAPCKNIVYRQECVQLFWLEDILLAVELYWKLYWKCSRRYYYGRGYSLHGTQKLSKIWYNSCSRCKLLSPRFWEWVGGLFITYSCMARMQSLLSPHRCHAVNTADCTDTTCMCTRVSPCAR